MKNNHIKNLDCGLVFFAPHKTSNEMKFNTKTVSLFVCLFEVNWKKNFACFLIAAGFGLWFDL